MLKLENLDFSITIFMPGGYFRVAILELFVEHGVGSDPKPTMRATSSSQKAPEAHRTHRSRKMKPRERVVTLALLCYALVPSVRVSASGLGASNVNLAKLRWSVSETPNS